MHMYRNSSLFSKVYVRKDSNPEALSTYLASELTKLGVLYLHVFEPRDEPCCLKSIRNAFEGTLISNLVSLSRLFLANHPDLPNRFEVNSPLNKHDKSTFYRTDPVLGYTDYPLLEIKGARSSVLLS
uniref:NADH:flavin oxidoreductase/NADH oxidase N-terminal domain-containing protein n=1 Tax=Solanum lycopersicum TaxID=4081 RepID=A0A3Q7GUT1_SOLLC